MKTYILAGGNGERWNNYKDVPKPLLEIDGEPILHRMVRLCRRYTDDVTIIGPYTINDCRNWRPGLADKPRLFRAIAEDSGGPFVILNGDCYYTEQIIEDAFTRACDQWHHYCCPGRNNVTGKPYGEGYVHVVADTEWWTDKLDSLIQAMDEGAVHYDNDWVMQRWLYGYADLYTHIEQICEPYDIFWEDETDDFDFPRDYDRFMLYTCRWEE